MTDKPTIRFDLKRFPSVTRILNGTATELGGEISYLESVMLIAKLCRELERRADRVRQNKNWTTSAEYDEWLRQADRFIGFATANLDDEPGFLAGWLAAWAFRLPLNSPRMPQFDAFTARFKDKVGGPTPD